MTTCRDVMTTEPECCEPNIPVDKIAQTMRMKNIGTAVIVDSMDTMKPVGIVTDRDLAIRVVADDRDPHVPVSQVMTENPVSCRPDDDINAAIQLMEQRQIRRVPVVDNTNKLVGIISQGDIATRLHDGARVADVVEEVSEPGAER